MDPDATLKAILAIVKDGDHPYDKMDNDELVANLEDLTELIKQLDEWIQKGGFIPKRWKRS